MTDMLYATQAHQEQHQVAIRKRLTDDLVALQQATPERPYSITHRLKLAKAYKRLGYPDLAAGDAYKALLLIDEVAEGGEYYEEALEAAKDDYIIERVATLEIGCQKENKLNEDDSIMNWAQIDCSTIAYVSNGTYILNPRYAADRRQL